MIDRDGMGLENASRWRKNVNHGAGPGFTMPGTSDDVPAGIQNHPIYAALHSVSVLAEGMQQRICPKRVIVLQRIRAQLPRPVSAVAALGHVQGTLVLGKKDPVRRSRVVRHAL